MRISVIFALAASISSTYCQVFQGFNYGSVFTNNAPITQQDYENEFNTAKQLAGTSGFTSARLFTMIQAGTTNSPTQAIPAAIATKTNLLLGLFLSSTDAAFDNELAALTSAITQYGSAFVDLVIGISAGSEDLYRISPIGIENMSGVGDEPDTVVNRIKAVRSAISGTALNGKPVGHVDTWTAYVNSSNNAVIDACDFVGMDAYPYFQNTMSNGISDGASLFFEAYNATVSVSGGKPVWITETGWPTSGPTENLAVPSLSNAQTYWDQVACRVLGQITTFWFTLQDAFPNTPSPSFGLVGSTLSTKPLYDLSCSDSSSSSSSTRSLSSTSSTMGGASSVASVSISATTDSATSPSATVAPSGGTTSSLSASVVPSVSSTPVPPSNSVPPVRTATTYTTLTTCPVTYTSGKETFTTTTTSPVAVTSTPGSTLATVITTPTATTTAGSCPTSLSGDYQYPHLIVPIDESKPDAAENNGYNGYISSSISSIFNFDIPPSYQGKTCTLVFLFPTRESLQTSNYTLSGSGGIDVARLQSPATSDTTYKSAPAVAKDLGSFPSVLPGNSYIIASGLCYSGSRVGYKVSGTGSLDLEYFQDYNPSPIGLYITAC